MEVLISDGVEDCYSFWVSDMAHLCSKNYENVHTVWLGNFIPQDCVLRKLPTEKKEMARNILCAIWKSKTGFGGKLPCLIAGKGFNKLS